MASSVTIAQINELLADVGPQAVDEAVSRFATLFALFDKKDASDAQGPTWSVKVTGNTSAGSSVPGADLPAASAAAYQIARLNWGNYPVVVSFSQQGLSQIAKAKDLGQELANMIEEQIREQAMALASAVHTGLIAGSDVTKDIMGICTAIAATGTYAGLDRSTYTDFGCYVAANSGTPRTNTVAIMDAAYDYAVNTVGLEPGNWVILCGTAQESTMRGFSTGAASNYTPYVPGVGVTQALSKSKVAFRDIPVLAIPGYTTGRIDFVNLSNCWIECLNGAESPFLFLDGAKDANSDLTVFQGYFNGQLVLRNPRHNAFSIQDLA